MKTFTTLLIAALLLALPVSCAKSTSSGSAYAWRTAPQWPTPELVSYQANPWVTKYSYRIAAGDTCQMALRHDVIFISYETAGDAVVIHVKVEHP